MSLVLDKVSFCYPNTVVLQDFSHTFATNKVTVIVGRSGCGKSTFLNCIANILPYSGNISGNQRLSYVFQQPTLIPNISVYNNLAIVMNTTDKSQATIINNYLKIADMSHLAKRRADTLSGGEQQRVALLRAFVADNDVLLFDEPMQWLDIVAKQNLTQLLLKLLDTGNKTAIYVTHDLYECMSIADDIYVASGRPMQLTYVDSIQQDKCSRDVFDDRFNLLKKQIVALLSGQHQ